MSSPAYMNKNSNEYTMTEKYLKMLYPGTVQPDATGRMMSAAYDMTLAQFYDTQQEIELQIKEAAQTHYIRAASFQIYSFSQYLSTSLSILSQNSFSVPAANAATL